MHERRSSLLSGAPVISARLCPIVGILEGDTARTVNASLTSQRELAHLHKISTCESAGARDVTVPRRRPILSGRRECFRMCHCLQKGDGDNRYTDIFRWLYASWKMLT